MLGIDPDPGALWPVSAERLEAAASRLSFGRSASASASASTSASASASTSASACAALLAHCVALIDAAADACVAAKPQLARFELLGAGGREVLGEVVAHARDAGLLVIADGKRGDIDVTARAYADSLLGGAQTPFGHVTGLEADLLTVNPLMGRDALAPFVAAARERGAGVLVLVRTSNPGAADVMDLELRDGGAVWERLAGLARELGEEGVGAGGLSDVGAVMGTTEPQHLERARELMPSTPFLLPGVGAQGGRVQSLGAAFAPGRAGGLVSASRSIAGAHAASGGDPAGAARAEAERLRETAWGLSEVR